MTLENLTLDQLRELATTLTQLDDVGAQLAAAGLDPVFDLTPGAKMLIRLGVAMPSFEGAASVTIADIELAESEAFRQFVDNQLDAFFKVTPSTEAAPDRSADVAPMDPPPADPPVPVWGEPETSVLASSTVSEAVVEAEERDGGQDAAPEPSVAPIPGSGSALAAKAGTVTPWTAEEDSRLLYLVLNGICHKGLSRRHAAFAAAAELGRPEEGTAFRCKTKLRALIDLGIAQHNEFREAGAVDAKAAADAAAAPAPKAAGPVDAPVAAQPAAVPPRKGWQIDDDIALLEFAILGWPAGDIASELGFAASEIKPRLDELTGLHSDPVTGKLVRTRTRDQAMAVLKAAKVAAQ